METQKWIDTDNELPEDNISVLVIDEENDIWIMQHNDFEGWHCTQEGWTMNVLYWMNLPTPPNK